MSGESKRRLESLGSAIVRLREALAEPRTNRISVDGTIQRFEFVIKLYWKTLKALLAVEGVETMTPREVLARAYQAQWLEDEAKWLGMLKDRNETSHIYDEAQALRIYGNIETYLPEMERTWRFLLVKFGGS